MGFEIDARNVLKNMSATTTKVKVNTRKLGNQLSSEFERDARSGARWTDHSGYARRTLKGETEHQGDSTRVALSGDAEYQEYLEFGHGERFAIIYPIWEEMRARLAKVYGQTALRNAKVSIKRNNKRKR